jgi:hypothetical protein
MCAIRRVNDAHSKLQLNRFSSKKNIFVFWLNEQYTAGDGQHARLSHPFRRGRRSVGLLQSAAGSGLGTTAKYLRRTRNGAADSGLGTTIKYL